MGRRLRGETAPPTVVMMTFSADVKHGLPTSHEERIHQAVWLIGNGTSQEAAAAAVNIKSGDIKRAWQRVKADQRADEVGVLRSQWDHIASSSKQRLANIIIDEGFKAAANLVFRANLGSEEVSSWCRPSTGSRAARVRWRSSRTTGASTATASRMPGPARGLSAPVTAAGISVASQMVCGAAILFSQAGCRFNLRDSALFRPQWQLLAGWLLDAS